MTCSQNGKLFLAAQYYGSFLNYINIENRRKWLKQVALENISLPVSVKRPYLKLETDQTHPFYYYLLSKYLCISAHEVTQCSLATMTSVRCFIFFRVTLYEHINFCTH